LPNSTDQQQSSRERGHYDRQAERSPARAGGAEAAAWYRARVEAFEEGSFRAPYRAWLGALRALPGGEGPLRILDLGCGQGVHTVRLQQLRPEDLLIGVDLSRASLEVARRIAGAVLGPGGLPFVQMDAHRLAFDGESFDCVADFGAFSSLEFERVLAEIHRVLKPGGRLVAVETLGHNPLLNLHRRLGVLRGRRTRWAARHIFKETDLERLRERFASVQARPFTLAALLGTLPAAGGARALERLERLDHRLFERFPPLGRQAFKIVVEAVK
jgi:ubiquinone/menaquinone biosynthesis C-methylase UbiE